MKNAVSKNIEENIRLFKEIYNEASDIKMREMQVGQNRSCKIFMCYIEVALSSKNYRESAIGNFLSYLEKYSKEEIPKAIEKNEMGLSDAPPITTVEDAAEIVLIGDAVIFVDGYDRAIKIPDAGYPNMGVTETDSEKVVRGSNEGFSESVKINTALIRRRIKSTKVAVKEIKCGVRSNTNVDIVYMKDLVMPKMIDDILKRLEEYKIDGVLDSGVLEQLSERKWYSPFPEFQTTVRPDRAAFAVTEGKVVVLVDNSPIALILPADFNSFLKTTDDYYNRTLAASLARMIRYIAAFFAAALPGLYLAVTNFHTQILPTTLLLSFWENRIGVPFPEVFEVILMELSFELLREAGIRLPGAMGNTIGIVGGLIIGQSAVEANLVSPIVVIIVAFTALCSFAIPNEEFAFAFRILKFFIIIISAWMGFFGFLIGMYITLIHLSKLESFGVLYLQPFVEPKEYSCQGKEDSIVRFPLQYLNKRPYFVNDKERIKLRKCIERKNETKK